MPPILKTEKPGSVIDVELQKLDLERRKHTADVLKWIVVAAGAIVSFIVIDYGKLRSEEAKSKAENQRQLLQAYLESTDAPQPDVWRRKLHVLHSFSDDPHIRDWAKRELEYVDSFSGLDSLYRETLRVASELVNPTTLSTPERGKARARYEQLYWADLPFAGESEEVIQAMIDFREQLFRAEKAPKDETVWASLSNRLIQLSEALKKSLPRYVMEPENTGESRVPNGVKKL